MGSWVIVLYPEAGEAGGSFRSAARLKPPSAFAEPPLGDYQADAVRRARGKVRRYCTANRLNRLGTLTYAEPCRDPRRLREDLGAFFRRLRSEVGPLAYLWVPEWHPGGHGLHVHFVVGRFVHWRTIKAAWGRGIVDIRLLSGIPVGSGERAEARLAARYLAKYVGKDLGDAGTRGLHRYEVAQGFQEPGHRIETESVGEALGWASIAMGGPPERVWFSSENPEWAGPPAVWSQWP